MKCPNIYALYLPQYHKTPHNDMWWGEGFTDWEAVKKGEPLFEGHNQPKIPLNNNYYDLSDASTLKMQAKMAKEYQVDGFIFYHYYFGFGRMELQKPAEILLNNKDIDMPFCFSWANQSWIRTWSKIAGNVWGEKFEGENKGEDNGILVEQKYGDYDEWERHFYYLLPFFRDPRYIRIDNKPLFIFHMPKDIECLNGMIASWREMATSNGLDGLYLVGYNTFNNESGLDAIMMPEPSFSIRKLHKNSEIIIQNGVRCIDYEKFWQNTIATLPSDNQKTFFTGACGFDTTPRRGKDGECLINNSPELFQKYLKELLQKALYYDCEFIAINAWNEWGEGMYLEPDKEYGYSYLESVKGAKQEIELMEEKQSDDFLAVIKKYGQRENEQSFLLAKFQYYYKVYSKWIEALYNTEFIFHDFLKNRKITSVAIYGFADIGHKLLNQLRRENINVEYAIDQYVGSISGDIKVYRPEEQLPNVDAIIITAYDPDDIKRMLHKKVKCQLYSVGELLDD